MPSPLSNGSLWVQDFLSKPSSPSPKEKLSDTQITALVREALFSQHTSLSKRELQALSSLLRQRHPRVLQTLKPSLDLSLSALYGKEQAISSLALHKAVYHSTSTLSPQGKPAVINAALNLQLQPSWEDLQSCASRLEVALPQVHYISDSQGKLLFLTKAYRSHLPQHTTFQRPSSFSSQEFKELIHWSTPQAIANLMNREKLPLHHICKIVSPEKLKKILPLLSHFDYSELQDPRQCALWLSFLSPHLIRFFHVDFLQNPNSFLMSTHFPSSLPHCTTFHLKGCSGVTHLPKLPRCQQINCSDNSLVSLPSLPLCTFLNCANNALLQVTELATLEHCTALYCQNNQLHSLPNLPVCMRLLCHHNLLQQIPPLPMVSYLNCQSNLLQKLPPLPHCIYLDCDSNSLTSLPLLDACKTLHCRDNQLTQIRELPQCRSLDCSGNTWLHQFPESLPYCTLLNFTRCPASRFALLPRLPLGAAVHADLISSTFSYQIPYKEVENSPRSFLRALGEYLACHQAFPLINYLDSPGIDSGGLTRDFFSRLISSLFGECATATQLKLKEGFPCCNPEQDDQLGDYHLLASLLPFCFLGHKKLTTGPLFSEGFYRALPFYQDPLPLAVELLSLHPKLKELTEGEGELCSLPPQELKKIGDQVLFLIDALSPHQREEELSWLLQQLKTQQSQKALKEAILEEAHSHPLWLECSTALKILGEGLHEVLPAESWELLCTLSPLQLKERIEGKLSASSLTQALDWRNSPSLEAQEKMRSYLGKWIEMASERDLKKFLFAVTANQTLSLKEKIFIDLFERGPLFLPLAHTCEPSLELSSQYPSQKRLERQLQIFLDACQEGGFSLP